MGFLSRIMVLVALSAALASAQGLAQEPVNDDRPAGAWEFLVAPYAWFTALSGSAALKGRKVPLDAPFGDIVSDLNIGVMTQFEVRKGKVGAFVDPVFASLSSSETAGPFQIGGATIGERQVDSTLNLFTADVGLYYRVLDLPLDGGSTKSNANLVVEPYVGARIWSLWGNLSVPLKNRDFYSSAGKTWADAIVGARTQWNITDRWNLSLIGDIGTGSSDFTGQGMLLAGYRFGLFEPLDSNVILGYRALYDDYTSGSGGDQFGFNATLHGPVLGLALRF